MIDAWESYGAGLYLKNLDDVWVENVNAHDAQNGILIARTTHATIYQSDLSRNSGWGIALYGSSRNNLLKITRTGTFAVKESLILPVVIPRVSFSWKEATTTGLWGIVLRIPEMVTS